MAGASGYVPHGIEVDRQEGDGAIYFTGRDPNEGTPGVFKVHATSGGAPVVVWKGAPLVDPDSIAVSHSGVVYVSDRAAGSGGQGRVFAIDGQTIARIASGFRPGAPAWIALNREES